jgi:hypothetical protein
MDVGPWLGSLMVIVGLAITVLMGKYSARLNEQERRNIEAKRKGRTA